MNRCRLQPLLARDGHLKKLIDKDYHMLLILTGLRRNVAAGPEWRDINLEEKYLTISAAAFCDSACFDGQNKSGYIVLRHASSVPPLADRTSCVQPKSAQGACLRSVNQYCVSKGAYCILQITVDDVKNAVRSLWTSSRCQDIVVE